MSAPSAAKTRIGIDGRGSNFRLWAWLPDQAVDRRCGFAQFGGVTGCNFHGGGDLDGFLQREIFLLEEFLDHAFVFQPTCEAIPKVRVKTCSKIAVSCQASELCQVRCDRFAGSLISLVEAITLCDFERGRGEVLLQGVLQLAEVFIFWIIWRDQIVQQLKGRSSYQREESRHLLVVGDAVRLKILLQTSDVRFPVIRAGVERLNCTDLRSCHDLGRRAWRCLGA